jgi:anti-sigma-K factor RskA
VSTDDDARALLGAYALDAVDDVERREVERLLERDADAAREVAGLQATAALLGAAGSTQPPAALRADVLAAISRTRQVPAVDDAAVDHTASDHTASDHTASDHTASDHTASDDTAVTPGLVVDHGSPTAPPTPRPTTAATPFPTSSPTDAPSVVPGTEPGAPIPITSARSARTPRRSTTWLAIAATALGAAVVPSVLAVQQAQRGDRAEQQAQAVAELLADPDATVVRADVTGGGTAVGVLADERALFTATGLDEPGAGREYQLWILRDGEALPEDVMPDDDGSVRALADDFRPGDALAVTVEPAGGSQTPTTDPVVVLTPTEV